jgi:hypothetical protein
MSIEKRWWQVHKPLIVSKNYTEQFFRDLTVEDFKKLFFIQKNWPVALHIILAEYFWIKNSKPNYFIEGGITQMLLDTKTEHTAASVKLDGPIGLSWHPDDKLPPTLVYPTKEAIFIHTHDPAADGTFSLVLPYAATGSNVVSISEEVAARIGKTSAEIKESNDRLEKATLGLLTYMQAFPDMVRPGLPMNMKERCARFFGKAKGVTICMHPRLASVSRAHMRSGHWRVLGHERFKRNPDGSIRIVYVNPAIVGFMTRYTVESEA